MEGVRRHFRAPRPRIHRRSFLIEPKDCWPRTEGNFPVAFNESATYPKAVMPSGDFGKRGTAPAGIRGSIAERGGTLLTWRLMARKSRIREKVEPGR